MLSFFLFLFLFFMLKTKNLTVFFNEYKQHITKEYKEFVKI